MGNGITPPPPSLEGAAPTLKKPVEAGGTKILIVDDRPDKCMALESVLSSLGEEILVAHSGAEAIELVARNDFAVILLDVEMPRPDGYETALLIRQHPSAELTPIIFVTGHNDTETHVSRGYSLGAVDYILTPVLPDVLRTKVSVFVDLHRKTGLLRQQADSLRRAHDEMELHVKKRTFQLAVANQTLQTEIAERLRGEETIRKINTDLERRVAARTTELANANQELEAFTYSVAHDLQAPLRNIQSYIQLLEEQDLSVLPPDMAQCLGRIASRTKYMAQLITGLLNLSTIGKQGLRLQPVDLNAIVEEVAGLLKSEQPGRVIEWKLAPLSPADCDANLVKQVFANLLSNAVKYTKPIPRAVIEVGQKTVNGENILFIRDNGVGFNMKYAGKLFGVFQRLHPATDFEGTGIGLATVDRIIHRHGGRIWAEAEEKKGATFYFTLKPAP